MIRLTKSELMQLKGSNLQYKRTKHGLYVINRRYIYIDGKIKMA
jgi:hypothetical protein